MLEVFIYTHSGANVKNKSTGTQDWMRITYKYDSESKIIEAHSGSNYALLFMLKYDEKGKCIFDSEDKKVADVAECSVHFPATGKTILLSDVNNLIPETLLKGSQ